jgi:HEAT repeat protein
LRGKFWISSILAAAVSAAVLPQSVHAQPAPVAVAGDPVQSTISVLRDSRASTEARNAAAKRLVAIRSDQSRAAIVDVLSDGRIPASQIAIAQALADDLSPDRDPSFVAPLITLLKFPGLPGLKATQALAIYNIGNNNPVLIQLIGMARGTSGDVRSETARANATLALGYMLDHDAAQTLIDLLTSTNETPEVRDNAAKALANMTGDPHIGVDQQAWQNWWAQNQAKPAAQFRNDLLTAHAIQLAAIKRQFLDTQADFAQMLDDWYHSLPLDKKQEKLQQYLTAAEPIKRAEGARIIHDDKINGYPLPPLKDAQAQLQKLISDPDPRVRLAAADAILVLNDRSATTLLILQLQREPDADVKAALVKTLGQVGDVSVVTTLLPLLEDPHDVVKAGAARALAALGPQLANISRDQATQAGRQLKAIFDRTTPGSTLRQEVIGAMAELRDPTLLPVFKKALYDLNETPQVKKNAIKGIANLPSELAEKSADDIIHCLGDPDAIVRQAACEALPAVNGVGAATRLVDMLQPGADDPAVQAKAWDALNVFLSKLDLADLKNYANRFNDAGLIEKSKTCLETIRDKLLKSGDTDQLALAHQSLGETLMNPAIADYDGAAAEFDAAIANLAPQYPPRHVRMVPLYRMRLQATLRGGKYPEAMNLANDAISKGALDPKDVGTYIKEEVNTLETEADKNPVLLDKAIKLIDESSKIDLPTPIRDQLTEEKTRVQQQMERNKGSGYTTPGDSRLDAIIGATAKRQ